jgi:outer membrane protein TolC
MASTMAICLLAKVISRIIHHFFHLVGFALIALFMVIGLTGYSQNVVSLKMCHDSAEVKFPLAEQKAKFEQINQLKQDNLASNYLPTLNLKAKATYQSEVVEFKISVPGMDLPAMPHEQYSANIEINQLIYDGGNSKAAQKVNEQNSLINIQKVEVDIYGLKVQINQLYFNCLLLQENEGILQLTHETIIEKRKMMISAVDQGMVLESELDNLSAEMLRLEQQIIEIKSAKAQVLKALEILSCVTINENSELLPPQIGTDNNTSIFRPEHKLFQNQSQLLDATLDLTQKKRMPTLAAFANGGYGKPGYDFFNDEIHGFYMVGAQFQWNIWDWKQTNREKQQLSIQKLIVDDNRKAFDKNLTISLSEAELREQKLEQLITKDKAIVELQSRISNRSAEQMKNGTKTSSDYLRDLNAEKQARINLESRQIQLIQSQVDELMIKGAPLF